MEFEWDDMKKAEPEIEDDLRPEYDLRSLRVSNRGGRGDHGNFEHAKGMRVTLSGQLGDDAKPYQEREVRTKIQESKL